MQTITIGAYSATLAPTRDVGAFQAKLAKCNGKSRKSAIRDTRTKGKFPKFEAGMSTADYVRLFESWGTPCKPVEWAQLNSEPCTLYSGADTCETLPDGFETWEDFDVAQSADAAPESTLAAANDDAAPTVPDPEPAAHGEDVAAPVPDLETISAWSAAVNGAVRRGLDRTPIQHLPNYARMAIERADADSGLRSTAKVSELVRAYAAKHGAIAEEWEIASALYICGRRFWDFDAAPDGAPVAAPIETAPAEVAPPHYAIGDPLTTQSDSVPVPGKLDAAQTARTAKILDRLIRSDGALMTRRAFVELKVADGLRPTCELQDKIKPMTRMQVFRATNEQQRAHDARVKTGGKREVFYLGGFEVTKAEHDYAAQIVAALQAPIADPVPSKSEPDPVPGKSEPLADRIMATIGAREPGSILTAKGYAQALEVSEIDAARECEKLAVSGKLVRFDYSAQGFPPGFALPYLAPGGDPVPPDTQPETAPASPPATHSEPEKALPYAGFDPVRGAVYRAHIETAKHSRAIDPTFSGMLRRPRSAGFMVDFMAPEVRAHRNAIAAMVRACRAKRASVPLPADTGPLTTDTGADLGEQSAHRIGLESFERGEAMMSDASLRRAFGSQAERDAYYRGYDDAERAARPAPATHSDPAPARPVYANDHLAWAAVESGRAEPDEYQARLIECLGEVKAGGLFYNSDTYPATAELMTARYGYPDWRGDRGQHDGVMNPFGMDCYRANCVVRARAERERERGAAATFTVGQRFARLIFNDGKQRTAAELVTLDPAGFACKLKAKSGRNSVEVTCSAYALSLAVIRAEERGKVLAAKRARARPEPIAPMPAEPAPVPSKSEPDPVPGESRPLDPARDAPADDAPQYDLARLRRIHDRINATRATTATAAGRRWVRVMNALRSLIAQHPYRDCIEAERAPVVDVFADGFGFYWFTLPDGSKWTGRPSFAAAAAELAGIGMQSRDGGHKAERPRPGRVSLMLHNVLAPLQNAAPDGVPTVAGLESEAARIEASGETMRDVSPQYAAECAEVARSLRELAETERARLAYGAPGDDTPSDPAAPGDDESAPAPLDGLDVAELDGLAEFERAGGEVKPTAPAYRDDALCAAPDPCLRIPDTDPRIRIPARFAPVYLLQA